MIVSPFASLRGRLFVVVAAALTPFLLNAALTGIRELQDPDTGIRATSLGRARVTTRRVDEHLRAIERLLDSAQTRLRRTPGPATSLAVTDSVPELLNQALSIALLDTSGARKVLLFGDGSRIDEIPTERRRAMLATALVMERRSRVAVPQTLMDESTTRADRDSIALLMVRALPRQTSPCNCLADTKGVLVAVLSDRAIRQLLGSEPVAAGGTVVLLGTAGEPIGHLAMPERWLAPNVRDTAVLGTILLPEGTLSVRGADGVTRAVGFMASTILPLRVFVGLPAPRVFIAPRQRMRETALLTAIALAIAAVGVMLASRTVRSTLRKLVDDATRIVGGDLSHRTLIVSNRNEFGALGSAINSLAADMEQQRSALEAEVARAYQMFDDSPVPMWITDASIGGARSGRIQRANRAAESLFGVEKDGLMGQRDGELLEASAALFAIPTAAEPHSARTGRVHIRRDGIAAEAYDVSVSFPSVARQAIRIVTVLGHTVLPPAPPTSAAALSPPPEPSLPAAGADGSAPDSLVSFAGHVAADFTALLNGIEGFTTLARDSGEDPDITAIAIDRIRDLAHRGLTMARHVQAYGQRDALHPRVVDLNATITDAAESLAGTLADGVQLEVLFNTSPANVSADPALLHHVISVLIANARDVMLTGGTLTLATTALEVPLASDEVFAAPPGTYIVLTVADTGSGLTADARQHMFDPFYSTKRDATQGVGLGLASVQGIAAEHGWTIGVESEQHVGTAVSIYFPTIAALAPDVSGTDGVQPTSDTEPSRNA
ncbi:MAG: PAS domain-containing protein [Gemmatimonadaceae bacterium]|nr:PAS domain-containing protein [Gemmatimonadaceae bacterium]